MDADPDPICPGRLESDPDPVNIRRDPPPCFDYNYIYQKKRAANVGLNFVEFYTFQNQTVNITIFMVLYAKHFYISTISLTQ